MPTIKARQSRWKLLHWKWHAESLFPTTLTALSSKWRDEKTLRNHFSRHSFSAIIMIVVIIYIYIVTILSKEIKQHEFFPSMLFLNFNKKKKRDADVMKAFLVIENDFTSLESRWWFQRIKINFWAVILSRNWDLMDAESFFKNKFNQNYSTCAISLLIHALIFSHTQNFSSTEFYF